MKRFYKNVDVEQADNGWRVTLDGRPLRTLAKQAWSAPNRALAEAAAAEWAAQSEKVDPKSMPVTQFVGTSLDRVQGREAAIIDELIGYGNRDLLCYRADSPADLVRRQAENWDPLLDWAANRFNARLTVTCGILPIDQPPSSLDGLRLFIEQSFPPLQLAALHNTTTAMGSLILALAVGTGHLSADRAFELSRLDEIYQEERWGRDAEAHIRVDNLQREIQDCHRVMELANQVD